MFARQIYTVWMNYVQQIGSNVININVNGSKCIVLGNESKIFGFFSVKLNDEGMIFTESQLHQYHC